jgi:hypothetical protein
MNGRRTLTDADIERMLEDIATRVDDPPAGELAAAVRARLETQSPVPAAPDVQHGGSRRRLRFVVAGVAVVVAATLALGSLPGIREAVADWFQLRGVLIEHRDTPPAAGAGAHLSLGTRVSLAEARRAVSLDVLLPAGFGTPDEVYVTSTPSGGRINLLYRPRHGLPAAAGSGVGLLVTEFRAGIDDRLLRKAVGAGVTLEDVSVAGERGFWIKGKPHQLIFADERGQFFQDRARLAGNTLLWQRGPLTLRVESGLSKAEAVRIAESLTTRGRP